MLSLKPKSFSPLTCPSSHFICCSLLLLQPFWTCRLSGYKNCPKHDGKKKEASFHLLAIAGPNIYRWPKGLKDDSPVLCALSWVWNEEFPGLSRYSVSSVARKEGAARGALSHGCLVKATVMCKTSPSGTEPLANGPGWSRSAAQGSQSQLVQSQTTRTSPPNLARGSTDFEGELLY